MPFYEQRFNDTSFRQIRSAPYSFDTAHNKNNRMLEHEQVVDGNAAVEMQATPELEEDSPSEIRTPSGDAALDLEQPHPENELESTESDEEMEKEEPTSKWYSCSVKKIIGLILLGFVVFIIVDLTTNGYTTDGFEAILEWIEDNPVGGAFVFVISKCTD
jgi:hypothetical protein